MAMKMNIDEIEDADGVFIALLRAVSALVASGVRASDEELCEVYPDSFIELKEAIDTKRPYSRGFANSWIKEFE